VLACSIPCDAPWPQKAQVACRSIRLSLHPFACSALLPVHDTSPPPPKQHAYFGSAIMALLLVHMALGINLGLSI
jgi:hypothetical protein